MCTNSSDAACRTDAPSLAAKAIMLILAHHKNFRSGLCFVSGETLAQEAGVDIRTVRRSIASLEEAGLIRVLPKLRAGSRQEVNRYHLTFADGQNVRAMQDADRLADDLRIAAIEKEGADTVSERATRQGDIGARQGDSSAQKTAPESPEQDLTGREQKDSAPDGAVVRKAELDALVEVLWAAASDQGRARSSKADLAGACAAALGRGHEPKKIITGMRGYFDSPDAVKDGGAFQKGVHRMVAKDRFLTFVPAPPPPGADPLADGVGTMDAPGKDLQRGWMRLFSEGRTWNPERGPEPGRQGCRIEDEIQREYGVEPFALVARAPVAEIVDADPLGLGLDEEDAGAFD